MLNTKRAANEYDSYHAQHDEYETQCFCSECGKYLGSKDFTYRVGHCGEFDIKTRFCPYCGEKL